MALFKTVSNIPYHNGQIILKVMETVLSFKSVCYLEYQDQKNKISKSVFFTAPQTQPIRQQIINHHKKELRQEVLHTPINEGLKS